MAITFRSKKIENYVNNLRVKKAILINQMEQGEIESKKQFLEGQVCAVDTIIQELANEFNIEIPERVRLNESNG